ncbi:hypothetical protein MRS76_17335 [Rhizobiaceae bacterium n13]|nr:hypothetical protein [Fererhizobium litorale]
MTTALNLDRQRFVGCEGCGSVVGVEPLADTLAYLESSELVRLAPAWHADAGPISNCFYNRTLLPSKTRVFVDFAFEVFQRERWPARFAGSLG